MSNAVYNSDRKIVGYRCHVCGDVVQQMWGTTCNKCRREEERHQETLKAMTDKPKEAAQVRHPLQDILDKENETGDWTESKLICALIIEKDNLKSQIATLQQRVAELEEERRKDIEDAFEEGVSIGIGCRIGTGVDVEYIDTKKALYLSQYDQTKTEGV